MTAPVDKRNDDCQWHGKHSVNVYQHGAHGLVVHGHVKPDPSYVVVRLVGALIDRRGDAAEWSRDLCRTVSGLVSPDSIDSIYIAVRHRTDPPLLSVADQRALLAAEVLRALDGATRVEICAEDCTDEALEALADSLADAGLVVACARRSSDGTTVIPWPEAWRR